MSKAKKIIDKWNENTPAEANISDVSVVLDLYFPQKWRHVKTGSHIVVQDEILQKLHGRISIGVNSLGEFTVCTVKGRIVKGVYLKRICKAIEIIEEWRKIDHEKRA